MAERWITPSKITAWLDCAHYLTLKHEVEAGLRTAAGGGTSAFAELLLAKGLAHEQECLRAYEDQGKRVRRVPDKLRSETFSAWAARTAGLLQEDDWDVLYQMPLVHDGIRGVADFLVRVVDEDGVTRVEPVDAKLARQEAKPGHVLQLCFYADALEAATGERPRQMHLWLGSGQVESLRVEDVSAYWRRLRARLRLVLDVEVAAPDSRPEPCDHCGFCEFSGDCEQQWRDEDSLVFVAGLRSAERAVLEQAGVASLSALADLDEAVPGLPAVRQERVVAQAALQRAWTDTALPPPHAMTKPAEDPVWGHGLELLPEPDAGDVFLDFEGHPFWRADTGLFFLFGLIEQTSGGAWEYRTWWAHDEAGEADAVEALVAYLRARRAEHPGMHVYHYNHTERSALQRLAEDHRVAEAELAELVETGAFVDLLPVVRGCLQLGAESYGLKSVELLTGYERGHAVDKGAGAVLEYERFMAEGAEGPLQLIADYNEDDVRATRALREWLVAQRPEDLEWRAAVLPAEEPLPELDDQVAALHAHGEGTSEHLLGDVLGYWRREWKAHLAPLLGRCGADLDDLLRDPTVLAGLTPLGEQERLGKNGRPITPVYRFALPEQDTSELKQGDSVLFAVPDAPPGYSSIELLDPDAGEVHLAWGAACQELASPPTVVVRNGWVPPRPKPEALNELAAQVLDPATHGAPSEAALALLRRDLPRFLPGAGPDDGRFTDDLDAMRSWVTGLDRTVVAVQGPPGTGKTYRGARQVRALLEAGQRVGITATSHEAIDNLLRAVVALYEEAGELDRLAAVRRGGATHPGVVAAKNNPAAAKDAFRLVAGTTWLFAGKDLQANPVDVLVVDEAGQMSLADALAATRSANSLLLLGDPLQLPQVAQASHPGGSGRSVLQHVLGEAATLPEDRGVFLAESRRMHPDVCGFVSQHVYEGRLTSHASCSQQDTALGTGLRWLRAEHASRSTSAPEEAELVHAEVLRLLGTPWVDQHGTTAPLTAADVLIVAPFNAQRQLLRDVLDADPGTRDVAVGTVDKFQGQEAAVVFFSMATSSAAELTRGADFLFSRNRFNVAVSRARCLAYLVCTEELLDTRGRDVEEMRLLSTFCAYAETAQGLVVPQQAVAPPREAVLAPSEA